MKFGTTQIIVLGALALASIFAQSSNATQYTTVERKVYVQHRPAHRPARVVYHTVIHRTYYVKDKSGIEKAGKSAVGLGDRSTKVAVGAGGKAVKETLKAVF